MTYPWVIGAAFFIGVLLPPEAAGKDQVAHLSAIGYSVHDTVSRMTFTIDGPTAYSTTKQGDALLISFPNMTAKTQLVGVRQLTQGGMVRSVTVTPQAGPKLSVLVAMGCTADYRIVQNSSSNLLSLEVLGRGAITTHKISPVAAKKGMEHPLVSPKVNAAVVDIAGMARKQLDEARHGDTRSADTSAMDLGHPPLAASLLLAAALGFPLFTGTAILLIMYYRRRSRRVIPVPVELSHVAQPVPQETPSAALEPPVPEQIPMVDEPMPLAALETVNTGDMMMERSFQIAPSMLQGNEQIELARRFAGETTEMTKRRIRKACATKTARTHRTRVAKRLGVGKGEVELALKLRDIAARRSRKEKKR